MRKTNYVKKQVWFGAYQRELHIIFLISLALFLSLSLCTYNPTDSSWWYATSDGFQLTNACGFVGAQIAALFFYLFGSGSFFCIAPLCFTIYLLWYGLPVRSEWDRYGAYAVFIVAVSTLSAAYKIMIGGAHVPGGFIGLHMWRLLYRWFDYVGAVLCIYTTLLASSIIITQLSFIAWFRSLTVKRYMYTLYRWFRVTVRALTPVMVRGTDFVRWIGQRIIGAARAAIHYVGLASTPLEYDAPEYDDPALDYQDTDVSALLHRTTIAAMPVEHVVNQLNNGNNENLVSSVTHLEHLNSQPIPETIVMPEEPSQPSEGAAPVVDQYQLPNVSIFIGTQGHEHDVQLMKQLEKRAHILEEKLRCFGIAGSVTSIKSGPVVTLFEYMPTIDSKISKIIALEDDLALALQALSIRIIAPIPGKSVVGFEVANARRTSVLLADIIQSDLYMQYAGQLPLILGKDTIGNNVVADLATMPHLLVAGSTGSGKSVALNSMLISLLCAHTPDGLRLILIDPKRLEFAPYADIAHLLFPIVTNPRDSVPVLQWVVHEMEERYQKMAEHGARNYGDYNKMMEADEKLPLIVVIIDELSDLMMTAGREIEGLIVRIAQMARAAGIHLIVATQRPSVDVITGLIKVNFPSRISFRVTSKVDSRTILDCSGADKLLGKGDMLFLDSAHSILTRVHGAYVSDHEIKTVTDHIRAQRPVVYRDLIRELTDSNQEVKTIDDELYEAVLIFLQEIDDISISLLQRKFRIGYNRSARIIEILQSRGLIMPSEGGKPRKVIR
ncbi:MAG TPA: DNA translocase FtsK [Candidatus Babeliales bacterium]|nr:DNA translocase FtsK [Candidatus Babeliales bacterium]